MQRRGSVGRGECEENVLDRYVVVFERLTLDVGGVFIYEDGGYNFVGSGDAHGISADGNWVGGSVFDRGAC